MKKIYLNMEQSRGITIMIFAEGTILKPKSWLSLYNHHSYIPIGNAVDIINAWQRQGANVIYLVAREQDEKYADIVERLQPDILIEDDCKSIGGAWQMCITKVKPELKEKIKHIAVPEFKGINHLSVDIKNHFFNEMVDIQ